ncbi:unnamed protein product [Protopolystoma xenopodis]|uniref:Uncharacterized protein n=1 Tax=Protopolystoma xenopodis TaxID=117903 RepID=A0A448X357_9PLAT|nr:unnamed protein product [Protopolystoma xenopodis]
MWVPEKEAVLSNFFNSLLTKRGTNVSSADVLAATGNGATVILSGTTGASGSQTSILPRQSSTTDNKTLPASRN